MIRTNDGQLYTGITTDIQRRWQEHSSGKGGARYFRARRPERLCLLEEHPDRSSASKREAEIKKLTKTLKETLVATHVLSIDVSSLKGLTPL
ncbi:MAG: GIY-YIG nuclease family protein [Gammaproteobacteria bacterium]|nr:MAG: GIY-YIG nuclease family protein [Gammaproteobacteria bacterium]